MSKKLFTVMMEDGDEMEIYYILTTKIETAISTAYLKFAELTLEVEEEDSGDTVQDRIRDLRKKNALSEITTNDIIICQDVKLHLV